MWKNLLILSIALLAVVCCQANDTASTSSPAEDAPDGPFDIANKLLVDRDAHVSQDGIIEAARELYSQAQDLEVKKVFQEILAKNYVYKGSCDKAAIDGLIGVRKMMIEKSKEDPFVFPQSQRRLNSILTLEINEFFNICVKQLYEEWEKGAKEIDFDEKKRLSKFLPTLIPCFQIWRDESHAGDCQIWFDNMTELYSTENFTKWLPLFDDRSVPLYEIDPYTGKFVVNDNHMGKIYVEYVAAPCEVLLGEAKELSLPVYLFSNFDRKSATALLRRSSSMKLVKIFMDMTVKYGVCKFLKTPDSTFLSAFAGFLSRQDQQTLHEKLKRGTLPFKGKYIPGQNLAISDNLRG